MADVITRLKIDSGEYDSKIARAVSGLKRMEEECRNVNGTLAVLEKDQLEYVRSLGQMQTVSTTVRGKISELNNAYIELRTQYKRLTDEEKNSDFGKALSASLDQLKQRVADSKAELASVSQELNSTGQTSEQTSGILDQLASKFTINIDAVKLFNIGMQAASAALDVAKDAFFASESNIDEWGRTVEGAKGAYNVFLDALNNGNWSNFFSNLEKAIQGGRDLYDTLDRLGSIKSNNQAAIALVQAQIQQLRVLKQQGQDVDDQIKQATRRLAALQGQQVDAGKKAGADTMRQSIGNYINTMGGGVSQSSIDKAIQGILQKGQAEFDKYRNNVTKFENWSGAQSTRNITVQTSAGTSTTVGKEQYFDINKLTEEQRKQYILSKAITEKETEIQRGISLYAQAVNEQTAATREEFRGNRYALQGSNGRNATTATVTTVKLTEEEKAQQKAEKELAAATERLTKARTELAEAQQSGDLKSIYAAEKKVGTAEKGLQQLQDKTVKVNVEQGKVDLPEVPTDDKTVKVNVEQGKVDLPEVPTEISVPLTTANLEAFISNIKEGINHSEIGSDMYNALTEQLNDATALGSLLNYALSNGIDAAELGDVSQMMWQKLFGEGDIPDEALEALKNSIGEALGKSLELDPHGRLSESKGKDGKSDDESWKGFQKSIGTLSAAMSGLTTVTSGLQALGIKIDGDFANFLNGIQGAISVVQGVISIINAFSVPSEVSNTAATHLNTSAMVALTAALKTNTALSFFHFASGGIVPHAADGLRVPGNNFSGDLVPAMVNSGEIILNRAQQGNLISQMQDGGIQNLHLTTEISGENLRIILQNNNQRHGYSDVFTFNM